MTTLALAARLARAGGRLRIGSTVLGNAVGALVLVLALAVPAAASTLGERTDVEHQILVRVVQVFLLLPVGVLLLSIGRLASGVRDRRLAALRLLGVTPGRTRWIAACENGIVAIAGALLGLVLAPVVARLIGPALVDRGWLARELGVRPGPAVLAGVVVVGLSMLVSLAPTRSLTDRALGIRRGTATRPSRWRLVPLLTGLALLLFVRWYAPLTDDSLLSAGQFAWVLLAGIAVAGLSVPIAVPVAVRTVADLLARWAPTPATQLAGRRMQAAPTASARVVAGLATALFLVTGSFGVLTAFQSVGQYQRPARAIEHGRQLHQLIDYHDGTEDPGDRAARLARLARAAELLAGIPGVRHIQPTYPIDASCGDEPCGSVFVGTCAELGLQVVVPDCANGRVAALISANVGWQQPDPATMRLSRENGGPAPALGTVESWTVDGPRTQELFPDSSPPQLFVPPGLSGLARFAGEPTGYDLITEGGFTVRDRLVAAADTAGVNVLDDDFSGSWVDERPDLRLQSLEDYDTVNGYAVLIWTLGAIVLGIGAVSVLLTALDQAIARRRENAGQLALGTPARTMRGSQALEVLVPLVVAQLGAIGLGYLTLRAYLAFGDHADTVVPNRAVLTLVACAAAAAVAVTAASVLGVGRRLTPELLRRE